MSNAPAAIVSGDQPESWAWPPLPRSFKVFDKYQDAECNLDTEAREWQFPSRGRLRRFSFPAGPEGWLQRTLAVHTQALYSPSALERFLYSLARKWSLFRELLMNGPEDLRRFWEERIDSADTAQTGKSILTLACRAGVGPWQPLNLPLVKGLDTKANGYARQLSRLIRKRARNIGASVQADVVRLLDQAAPDSERLTPDDLEGLVALALAFQHGMRPVQLIALRLEHVQLLSDCDGLPVAIVSFHEAKQGDTTSPGELIRQVKPEWASLVSALYDVACKAGRKRLFESTTSEALWNAVGRMARARGVRLDFTAYSLRHTAAQTLADAGHSRASIQRFLGHTNPANATKYIVASRKQASRINDALGASKLYDGLLGIAEGRFVSPDEIAAAESAQQIGGVLGDRLIAGLGLCKTGQPSCPYDPVSSCYGCDRYMPSLDRRIHEEAIAGMREQVIRFVKSGAGEGSGAYLQLRQTLAAAQQIIEAIDRMKESKK